MKADIMVDELARMHAPLLLMDRVHHKTYGATFMDQLDGELVMLQWDHEFNPFGGEVGCLIVCDAPVRAWRKDETAPWETCIVFDGTRESWRAAWRIARLLAGANPSRPALLDHATTTAICGLFAGSRTRCHFQLVA